GESDRTPPPPSCWIWCRVDTFGTCLRRQLLSTRWIVGSPAAWMRLPGCSFKCAQAGSTPAGISGAAPVACVASATGDTVGCCLTAIEVSARGQALLVVSPQYSQALFRLAPSSVVFESTAPGR